MACKPDGQGQGQETRRKKDRRDREGRRDGDDSESGNDDETCAERKHESRTSSGWPGCVWLWRG